MPFRGQTTQILSAVVCPQSGTADTKRVKRNHFFYKPSVSLGDSLLIDNQQYVFVRVYTSGMELGRTGENIPAVRRRALVPAFAWTVGTHPELGEMWGYRPKAPLSAKVASFLGIISVC